MKANNITDQFMPFTKYQEVINQFNIVCGGNIVCTAANIQDAERIRDKFSSCFPEYQYTIVDTLSQK